MKLRHRRYVLAVGEEWNRLRDPVPYPPYGDRKKGMAGTGETSNNPLVIAATAVGHESHLDRRKSGRDRASKLLKLGPRNSK